MHLHVHMCIKICTLLHLSHFQLSLNLKQNVGRASFRATEIRIVQISVSYTLLTPIYALNTN